MKKLALLGIISLVIVTLVACAQPAPAPKTTQAPAPAPATTSAPAPAPKPAGVEIKTLSIAGATAGAATQIKGEAMASAFRKVFPNASITVPITEMGPGLAMTGLGKADISIGGSARLAKAAMAGSNPFDKEYDLRMMAVSGRELLMLLATPDTKLTTFRDIVDKKFPVKMSTGPAGSGSSMVFGDLVEIHGTTYDAMKAWGCNFYTANQADSLGLLRDGLINVLGGTWQQPAPPVVQMSAQKPLVWLSVDDKAINDLGAKYGYDKIQVGPPPDFGWGYKFQNTANVNTVVLPEVIMLPASMSIDMAYTITKALFDSKAYLVAAHSSFDYMTPENTISLSKSIPLHDGTIKYFKEIGALK